MIAATLAISPGQHVDETDAPGHRERRVARPCAVNPIAYSARPITDRCSSTT